MIGVDMSFASEAAYHGRDRMIRKRKMPARKPMKFDAISYHELCEPLGGSRSSEGAINDDWLNVKLHEIFVKCCQNQSGTDERVPILRDFLTCYLRNPETYKFPVYKGLSKITDDSTFVKYFILLLRGMWH